MEVKFNSNSHQVFSFVGLQSPWFLPICVCLCCTCWGRCASPVAAGKTLPVTKLWEGSPPQGSLYCARGPCWWQNDGNVFLRGEEVWSCNPLGGEGHAWTRMAGCASSYILSYSIAAAHLQPIPGGQPTDQPSKLASLTFSNHSPNYFLRRLLFQNPCAFGWPNLVPIFTGYGESSKLGHVTDGRIDRQVISFKCTLHTHKNTLGLQDGSRCMSHRRERIFGNWWWSKKIWQSWAAGRVRPAGCVHGQNDIH